ncbi:MAG: hypothetical protein A2Z31_02210 [candidate division NC10 bacterium RBG_16_65_8]|nr:MAG: hypothetical protein A2Z31_02210 [candidate division NC10 bacterium RBG_16_65_8]
MRRISWGGLAAAVILLTVVPGSPSAETGANCQSRGGCGEVRDGIDPARSTDPTQWKCVKQEFRPMYPALPACEVKWVDMSKPIPMPITFGAPRTEDPAGRK